MEEKVTHLGQQYQKVDSTQTEETTPQEEDLVSKTPEEHPHKGGLLSWRVSPLAVIIIIAITFLLMLNTVGANPSGYMKISAGPAPQVEVVNHPKAEGQYYFTTIKVDEVDYKTYLWEKIIGDDNDLVPAAGGDSSVAQAGAYVQMEEAKKIAAQVAANKVDPSFTIDTNGAKVLSVKNDSPAAAAGVQAGDTVTNFSGQAVRSDTELVERVKEAATGVHTLIVKRGEESKTLNVSLKDQESLGVEVTTESQQNLGLDIETSGVGGPSGGLMFTLADIDALTGEDLTNGKKIAGTGTINPNGTVGAVGGTGHKVQGAAKVGAEVFFVPVADAEEAKSNAPSSIEVVQVENVDDAIAWLCANGGQSRICSN